MKLNLADTIAHGKLKLKLTSTDAKRVGLNITSKVMHCMAYQK
jgi:hypothetical protein